MTEEISVPTPLEMIAIRRTLTSQGKNPDPSQQAMREAILSSLNPTRAQRNLIRLEEDQEARNALHLPHPSVMYGHRAGKLTPQEIAALNGDPRTSPTYYDDITTKNYKEFNHEFFERAFNIHKGNLESWTPYRIRLTYRIVRELAWVKGYLKNSDRLGDVLNPLKYVRPTTNYQVAEIYEEYGAKWENHLDELFNTPERQWYYNVKNKPNDRLVIDEAGLGLMPPPVPLAHIALTEHGNLSISPGYRAHDDLLLRLFLVEAGIVIDHLALNTGTKNFPDLGVLGLAGVCDVETIRTCWPTLDELIAYEEVLLTQVVKSLATEGMLFTRDWLQDEHGYSQREIKAFMKMANSLAREIVERDQDEHRGIIILRLENHLQRATMAFDLKAEMNAIKQLSMILGLTRSEQDDQMTEFLNTVKTVSARAAHDATEQVLEHHGEKLLDTP